MDQKNSKRPWRKLVKKLQRKNRRQKMARQRDKELEEAELEEHKDPLYESWLEYKAEVERQQLLAEENERQLQEEQWLRRELLAQDQFRKDELKRKAEEAKLEAERLKQFEDLKKLQEQRQKKRDELKLQAEKETKALDDIMRNMQEYLDDCTMKTPDILERIMESRPGGISCEFFDKTNCCGYGPNCSFNHKRPYLSKIILIKHFFLHPLLEQQEHEEYSRSDSELELSERDLRDAYDEFCEDVWPVLEEFGTIINFRTNRNVRAHLRGHVFVEYEDKRSALKAFINLQNRYYASKRMSVEFSNIRLWRSGVCGMSFAYR
ncbi:U2 small nuclear ribonucleoprotein auxiliary factor 35 kDa subunit-related protein 2 isoform X2 [Calliphora vicina]|uniref:U2 small nuclear ribonucleoprotein auxiliary factor 35 kDa subunit-related protein 2 isoform X2 n=1 Tax=Calliphora vicina TaxID=7373 RepID=UPI00325C124B